MKKQTLVPGTRMFIVHENLDEDVGAIFNCQGCEGTFSASDTYLELTFQIPNVSYLARARFCNRCLKNIELTRIKAKLGVSEAE